MADKICPDCKHPKSHHLNLVGCCYRRGKFADSPNFEGGYDYCYCERLNGFVDVEENDARHSLTTS